VLADLIRGFFKIKTNSKMQINKKISFEFGSYASDYMKDKSKKPWFICNTDHLTEMVRKGDKNGIVIINFDDQAKLDEIPKGKPKQMMPVLITYPIKTNKDETTEKYSVFFTVSTKW
jgi:hypothetical protein